MNRLIVAALAIAASGLAATAPNHDKLNALIDKEWQYQLQEYPEMATAIGDNRFNDRLTDYSAAAHAKRAEHAQAALAEFRGISAEGLTAEDKLNLALMIQSLDVDVAGARFKAWEMPVNQTNGPHLGFPSMARDMPFKYSRRL